MSADLDGLKCSFAEAWFATGDPWTAACAVYVDNMWHGQKRLVASRQWITDPVVCKRMFDLQNEARANGKSTPDGVPEKNELVATIMRDATLGNGWSPDEKIKGWRLVAEMLGYIEKGGTTINNQLNQTRVDRVMLVQDYGTNDDWEAAAAEQQRKLIESSRAV